MLFAKEKRVKGNVALITVIIAGTILVTFGLSILASAIDVTFASKAYLNRNLAEITMTTCIEESMVQISRSTDYIGNFSIVVSDGATCSSDVSTDGTDPNIKVIDLTATHDGYTIVRTKQVDTSTSPYTLLN